MINIIQLKYFLALILLYYFYTGTSQQVELNGIISVHNSKYNTGTISYVANASVIAEFSSPTTSDNSGRFNIVFVNIGRGASVNLKVEKAGWEVVNKRDLQDVIVGRITPIKIYLAQIGELAKAQSALYNVSIEALTNKHDDLISQLRGESEQRNQVIRQLEQKLNRTITDRNEAEKILNKQLITTKKRLPVFAKELARVNLDFASKMYREAYNFFNKGEIEKAIESLDEAILDKQAAEAIKNLDSLKSYINTLDSAKIKELHSLDNYIESILLKAESYNQKKEYESVIEQFHQALSLIKIAKDSNDLRCAEIYWLISETHQRMNQIELALKFGLKYLEIAEQKIKYTNDNFVSLYQRISDLFVKLNNINKGVYYLEKALNKSQNIPIDGKRASIKKQLINLLLQQGNYLKQENKINSALEVYERLYKLYPNDKNTKRTIKQLKRKIKKL